MRHFTLILLILIFTQAIAMEHKSFYGYSVLDRKGNEVVLRQFKGKVLIIVNTATLCGFTLQYEELEALYKSYHQHGLEIQG